MHNYYWMLNKNYSYWVPPNKIDYTPISGYVNHYDKNGDYGHYGQNGYYGQNGHMAISPKMIVEVR